MNARLLRAVSLAALLGLATGCAGVAVGGVAAGGLAMHDRRSFGSLVDDAGIELKVLAMIKADEELAAQTHIKADSVNGIVLLTGEAATPALRDRVLDLTREIQSVRRIVNEMRVAPPSGFSERSRDAWLAGKAKAKLVATANLDATRIQVTTTDRAVYLMGLVNQREGDLATEAVRTLAGVDRVVKLFEYLDASASIEP
jgi:osmotically-inducible protein OsmY